MIVLLVLFLVVCPVFADENFDDETHDPNIILSPITQFRDNILTIDDVSPTSPAFQFLQFSIPNVDGSDMNLSLHTGWVEGSAGTIGNGIYKLRTMARLFLVFILTITFVNKIYTVVRQW